MSDLYSNLRELGFVMDKRCSGCSIAKPPTTEYFYRHKTSPDGLESHCKECRKAASRRWKSRNKEHLRAYIKKWKAENADHHAEYMRAWCKENRAHLRSIKWALNAKRRAKLAGAEGEYTFDEVWEMYESQEGLCAYCETPLFGEFHVDHMMPISRGGANDWSNLAVACPSCNIGKGPKTAEEYMLYRRAKEV